MKTETEINENISKLIEESKKLNKMDTAEYFQYKEISAKISALSWALMN